MGFFRCITGDFYSNVTDDSHQLFDMTYFINSLSYHFSALTCHGDSTKFIIDIKKNIYHNFCKL